jgi:hypothetical protein
MALFDQQKIVQLLTTFSGMETSVKAEIFDNFSNFSAPEMFRLQKALEMGQVEVVNGLLYKVKNLTALKSKFSSLTKPVVLEPVTESDESTSQELPQIEVVNDSLVEVGSTSILRDIHFTGVPIIGDDRLEAFLPRLQQLSDLGELKDAKQIFLLDSDSVTRELNQNVEQYISKFSQKLTATMSKVDVAEKRAFFLQFMQSPLFQKYINTGLEGLNESNELNQDSIVNTLATQTPNDKLTKIQFSLAAKVINEVRNACLI